MQVLGRGFLKTRNSGWTTELDGLNFHCSKYQAGSEISACRQVK